MAGAYAERPQQQSPDTRSRKGFPEIQEDEERGILEVKVSALATAGGSNEGGRGGDGILAVFDMREGCLSQLQLLGGADDGASAIELLGSLGDDGETGGGGELGKKVSIGIVGLEG